MTKMGFETGRKVRKTKYGNKPVLLEFGSDPPRQIQFKSMLEGRWANYLERQRMDGEIYWWAYEPLQLVFSDTNTTDPRVYTPDFVVLTREMRLIIYETKGMLKAKDHKKFRLTVAQFPKFDAIYLVIANRTKQTPQRYASAAKYSTLIIAGPLLQEKFGDVKAGVI